MKHIFKTTLIVIVFLLIACDTVQKQSSIDVVLTYDHRQFDCQTPIAAKKWTIDQVQFFISNLQVKDNQQQWRPLKLKVNSTQTDELALLSLICNQRGKAEQNLRIVLDESINVAEITDIAFELGVPFKDNHLNPLSQQSPLNVASMFWVWRTGHKFMRIEMHNQSDNWLFHLGSTGCHSVSPVRAPNIACLQQNRVSYQFKIADSEPINIYFSLSKLLNELTLSSKNNCQSEPDLASCQVLFMNVQDAFVVTNTTIL